MIHSWFSASQVYLQPRALRMALLGFSAGLPLLLVFSTLSAWLHDLQVERATIGFFAWVGITYSIKVFWAPVVDRLALPLLGRLGQRRSWILLAQLGIVTGLCAMALVAPLGQLVLLALAAVWVAFCSATQDVALDAYRIESTKAGIEDDIQGALAATYVFGYRIAMLVAGGGALVIADLVNWPVAYLAMAALMLPAMSVVLLSSEPNAERTLPQSAAVSSRWLRLQIWFATAVVAPFIDFFRSYGRQAVWILLLVGCYRISDIAMGVMANPFYLELGFSKLQIGALVKVFGLAMTLAGAFVGGLLVVRYGICRPLIAGAVIVAATNLLFVWLAQLGPDTRALAVVISADNFCAGFANSAFIAFLSSLVNRQFTATQYALFSSLMTLPGKFISGWSGLVVDGIGYGEFFALCALLGLPAIILSLWYSRQSLRH